MACSALNTLGPMGMSLYTLHTQLRNVVSMDRKIFLLKEFLVSAEETF